VLEYITEQHAATNKDMKSALSITPTNLANALKRLLGRGDILRIHKGLYTIVEEEDDE